MIFFIIIMHSFIVVFIVLEHIFHCYAFDQWGHLYANWIHIFLIKHV